MAKCSFQQASCEVTGEVFIKPITGEFKDLPREKVQQMIGEICQIFSEAGHSPVIDPSQPLWMQAEFLNNLLEFEMSPPCGCPSELRQVLKLA